MNRFQDPLLDRWLDLCKRLKVKGNEEYYAKLYKYLIHYYDHPARAYHTREHINKMFGKFDEIKHLLKHPDLVELAIWFHDAIYEIWANDNETRSANLAKFFITNLMELPLYLAIDVGHMIKRTAYFSKSEDESKIFSITHDSRYLLDIDLFVGLGGNIYDFKRNSELTAKEFEFVDPEKFKKERLRIFLIFSQRRPFYLTEYFREKYESRTMANIELAIKELEAELLPPKLDPDLDPKTAA